MFRISDCVRFGFPSAEGAGMVRGGRGPSDCFANSYFSVAWSPRIIVIFSFSQTLFSVLLGGGVCHGEGGKIYLCLRFSRGLNQNLAFPLAKNSEPGAAFLGDDV